MDLYDFVCLTQLCTYVLVIVGVHVVVVYVVVVYVVIVYVAVIHVVVVDPRNQKKNRVSNCKNKKD